MDLPRSGVHCSKEKDGYNSILDIARPSPLRRRRNHLDLQFPPHPFRFLHDQTAVSGHLDRGKGSERAGRVVDQLIRVGHAYPMNRRLMSGYAPKSTDHDVEPLHPFGELGDVRRCAHGPRGSAQSTDRVSQHSSSLAV